MVCNVNKVEVMVDEGEARKALNIYYDRQAAFKRTACFTNGKRANSFSWWQFQYRQKRARILPLQISEPHLWTAGQQVVSADSKKACFAYMLNQKKREIIKLIFFAEVWYTVKSKPYKILSRKCETILVDFRSLNSIDSKTTSFVLSSSSFVNR